MEHALVTFAIIFIGLCHAQDNSTHIINCNTANSCNSTIVKCDENRDCIVNCDYTCFNAQITCPLNGNCHIYCTGTSGCKNATINATQQNGNFSLNCESEYVNPDGYINDGICKNITVYGSELTTNSGTFFDITCGLERETCEYAKIKCANAMNCMINCEAGPKNISIPYSTCEEAYIIGPTGYDLTVHCHADEACKRSQIIGLDSSKLNISCSNKKSCCDFGMVCPPNTDGNKNCFLSGGNRQVAKCNNEYDAGITIVALNSWNDIDLNINGSWLPLMSPGTMVCGNFSFNNLIYGTGIIYYCDIYEWNCRYSFDACYVPELTTATPLTPEPTVPTGPTTPPAPSPTLTTHSPSISPTNVSTTGNPTTNYPTTSNPTTSKPTTSNPSESPSSESTGVPTTAEPTQTPTNGPTEVSSSASPSSTSASDFQFYIYIVISGFTLLILISLVYSKYISRNDFYRIGALLAVAIHFNDTLSDIFFCINISFHPKYPLDGLPAMLALSIGFVVIPSVITLFQLYYTIKKWKRSNELCQWLSDNVKILYFVCVIMGSSFVGVELCTSNLFNMKLFDMPLSRSQLMQYQTKSIYSTVLLENVPQLALQAWFLTFQAKGINGIVYASMSFSLLSIIISVASMASQKNIVQSQDFVTVEFDVLGRSIMANKQQCKNRVIAIQNSIAGLLGLDESLLEVMRPITIKKGLKVKINIYINNATAIDMNIEKDIHEAQRSGEIAEIVKAAWDLDELPSVLNVKYDKHESEERQQNAVFIGILRRISSLRVKQQQVKVEIEMNKDKNNNNGGGDIGSEREHLNEMELPPRIPSVVGVITKSHSGEYLHDSEESKTQSIKELETTKGVKDMMGSTKDIALPMITPSVNEESEEKVDNDAYIQSDARSETGSDAENQGY